MASWQAILLVLALAFAPGFFWLWYFYKKDKLEPEPLGLIRNCFFLGMVVVIPAALLERALPVSHFQSVVIVAPIVEECFKFFAILLTVYRSSQFDEPMDGVVYAAAVALGFASLENAGYLYGAYQQSSGSLATLTVLRSILSVPAHALFSIMWGYALGVAKFTGKERGNKLITIGLLSAIGLHALFNFVATLGPLWLLGMLILMPLMWQAGHKRIEKAMRNSRFPSPKAVENRTLVDTGSPVTDKSVWHENRVVVVLLMFLVCFPLGIYGLWKNSRFSLPEKVTIFVLWALAAGAIAIQME